MHWSDLSSKIQKQYSESIPFYAALLPLIKSAEHTLLAFDPVERYICIRGPIDAEDFTKAAILDASIGSKMLPTETFTFLKQSMKLGPITESFGRAFGQAKDLIGGQNSLTTTLVGAGLGGLGGYTLGRMIDKGLSPSLRAILPKQYQHMIRNTKWTPLLAATGGLAGAAPGLLNTYVSMVDKKSPVSNYPWDELDQGYTKAASDSGAMFSPTIPVDAFNKAIWTHAGQPSNPFGSKNPFGTNEQDLTPPPVAAAMSGIVSAAGAAKGTGMVSPWDVAQVTANVAAGGLAGSAIGLVTGKALGALAGLSPDAQQYVQQTGMWSGVLTTLANRIFN